MTRAVRFLRFTGVGLGGIVVQLMTVAALVNGVGLHYALATPIAVAAALVHNFVWHRGWTWRERTPTHAAVPAFVRFVLANGLVSFAGNQAVMVMLAGHLGVPAVPANLAAIAACGCVNFHLADRMVFGGRERPRSVPMTCRRTLARLLS